MEKDLYTYLTEYSQGSRIPMHMPGHKRRDCIAPYMSVSALQDFTEISATDNLHDARGVLKDSMALASKLWGSLQSFYLVGGSSCGILAGIRALTKRGDKILVSRNAHKSVFHAIELCGLEPIFVLPPQVPGFGICGSCTPQQVEYAFDEHPDIRLAIITSPTYEGVISDICGIAEVVHRYNALLFVDEAHGAHLGLHPAFEKSAVQCGADLVVQSLHKTLPAFTQTAILHVCSKCVDLQRLQHQLAVFQTSSPSYPLMLSADGCVRQILEKKDFFDAWLVGLAGFSIWASQLGCLQVLGHGNPLPREVFAFDETKLYVSTHGCNLTGPALEAQLSEYNIDLEMACQNGILAMTGAGDTIESVGAFAEALLAIEQTCRAASKAEVKQPGLPRQVFSPEFVLEQEFLLCDMQNSIGKVCAEYVWAYPPGIPLLIPGERIEASLVYALQQYKQYGIRLHKSRSAEKSEIAVIAS